MSSVAEGLIIVSYDVFYGEMLTALSNKPLKKASVGVH